MKNVEKLFYKKIKGNLIFFVQFLRDCNTPKELGFMIWRTLKSYIINNCPMDI